MKISFKSLFKNYWILFLLVAIKMVLQMVIVNPVYELHRDEFLHLDQANHLAAGYISVPPLTSWVSFLIKMLGGDVFWVRFFPALFGAFTLVVIWLIVEQLKGGILSKILVSTVFIFSVYARINILYQPNSFDILAWTCVFYFLIRFINEDHPEWLFYLMICFVLGFYNKYNIIFLLAGIVMAFLITDLRKVFINKYFYLSLAVGIILLLPNILWQYNHQFPVFHHMRVLKETQLNNIDRTGFLLSQMKLLSLSLVLIIAAFIAFFKYTPYKKYRVIGFTFLFTIAIFTFLRAKDYYTLGLYPVLFVFGTVFLEKNMPKKFKVIVPIYIAFNLLFFIGVAKFIFPLLSPAEIKQNKQQFESMGLMRWEDGKNHHLPQDFADMLGWKEMASKTLIAYNTLPDSMKRETLVFCDNYGQTGALNFYNQGRMAEAYSFNTDYLFWIPNDLKIKNVLLVGKAPSDKIQQLFEHFTKVAEVENPDARERGTSVFLLTGAKEKFSEIFRTEILRRKKNMDCF
ncbi:MAG: glycosyltransferase family 39 protein [Bacteroidia bacterium]|nr:glycosyltransferase family 39 protein [Bacteroidia bacterium]